MNFKTVYLFILPIAGFIRPQINSCRNIVTSFHSIEHLKGVRTYQSQRFEAGESTSQSEMITEEKPLRILINDSPFTVTMRTPGMDRELVAGLLYNEDVVRKFEHVKIELLEEDEMDVASVAIPEDLIQEGYMNARNFLSVSSCGVCGKTDLPQIEGKLTESDSIRHELILDRLNEMRNNQQIFEKTGGCHAAAILNDKGEIIALGEDIGRHNAVDKVIGKLILENRIKYATTLLVSGRISYEIVIKCFRAKIPVLAAVSAPSSLAIDYAKELGITVFAFCRQTRLTRFS